MLKLFQQNLEFTHWSFKSQHLVDDAAKREDIGFVCYNSVLIKNLGGRPRLCAHIFFILKRRQIYDYIFVVDVKTMPKTKTIPPCHIKVRVHLPHLQP